MTDQGKLRYLLTALLLAIAPGGLVVRAENIDPGEDSSQYAYGENVGWINAEPSGNGGPGVQVGDFELTSWMWAENIGWISLSCQNTGSCGTVDYGVVNDGAGNLSGYAYGENVGWLSFSCENASTCGTASYGVTISTASGDFAGYAYAENVGWVSFSCDNTGTCGSVPYRVKTDWCQSVAAAPASTPDLVLAPSGADTELSWLGLAGADWYEVTQGDLSILRSSAGDYTTATDQCIAEDETGTSVLFSGTPPPGDGFWFLVRGVNCKGNGTYDSGGASQIGLRDNPIAASGNDCL